MRPRPLSSGGGRAAANASADAERDRSAVLAASVRKVRPDHNFPLRYYYRSADNLLRQAKICKDENNVEEQFVLLLRFSSLMLETISQHKDYSRLLPNERVDFRKRLIDVLKEAESLKPVINSRWLSGASAAPRIQQQNTGVVSALLAPWSSIVTDDALAGSLPSQFQASMLVGVRTQRGGPMDLLTGDLDMARLSIAPAASQFQQRDVSRVRSLEIPLPSSQALYRHSIINLSQRRPPSPEQPSLPQIQYPAHVDTTPAQIPDLMDMQAELEPAPGVPPSAGQYSLKGPPIAEPVEIPLARIAPLHQPQIPPQEVEVLTATPSLAVATSEPPPPPPSEVADPWPGAADGGLKTKELKPLHISAKMLDEFMRLAKSNTRSNLETCAILAGKMKQGVFYITTLIVPKQEATTDSCAMLNEEELFEVQDSKELFSLGWIHTHPTQSCFMSSIDLHTHCAYQTMLSEAVAIVMAPTDTNRHFGIFKLTDPGGLKLIQQCPRRGFHAHERPVDGGPIYEHSGHVFLNPAVGFDVLDLRTR
eukprot:jgi/Chlat1/6230/Chrsp44S05816